MPDALVHKHLVLIDFISNHAHLILISHAGWRAVVSVLSCFKAYDIRGRVDEDLTEDLAFRIGKSFGAVLNARTVVVGRDMRPSSPRLLDALCIGLQASGCRVFDLGLCGTEEVCFATAHINADGGIMVTASHNPLEYNGLKLVGPGAAPLADTVFRSIEQATSRARSRPTADQGSRRSLNCRDAYVDRVLTVIDPSSIGPLHVLANPGNGAAGPTLDAVLSGLVSAGAPLTVTRLNHEPDGTFPNGVPNPLLPENQPATSNAVLKAHADMGLAWDGDFDRCFFFDETGAFIPGEYMVAALAQAILKLEPGASIVHDPRVIWNTKRVVEELNGQPIVSRTGHAFIKARMRTANAAYGGEVSAHHYFRDFMYCDSGMIPWVLMLPQLSDGRRLSDLVQDMRTKHPSSGEINFRVADPSAVVQEVAARFQSDAKTVDTLDGLSMSFDRWRFNLRSSNTEPLLRLNVEAWADGELLNDKTSEITAVIQEVQDSPQTKMDPPLRGRRAGPLEQEIIFASGG